MTWTPTKSFPEIRLRAAAVVPPIVLSEVFSTSMPRWLGLLRVPVASVPMKLPSIKLFDVPAVNPSWPFAPLTSISGVPA